MIRITSPDRQGHFARLERTVFVEIPRSVVGPVFRDLASDTEGDGFHRSGDGEICWFGPELISAIIIEVRLTK